MLKLLQTNLERRGIDKENIIYINFESMKYYGIRTSKLFYDYVSDLIDENQRSYLFFDEIQLVDRWEEAVNSFLVDFNVDIYITGSNSNLLSSELSTLLTGRYVQFRMYPLSFNEMLSFQSELVGENDRDILIEEIA